VGWGVHFRRTEETAIGVYITQGKTSNLTWI
jgi:hypothetical protein